mgnify:CR=1 FL=1
MSYAVTIAMMDMGFDVTEGFGGREFVLSHHALSKVPDRCETRGENKTVMSADLKTGMLDHYKGSFVAYQKGVLCGQSADAARLTKAAGMYYGDSGLSVFKVPEEQA